MKKRGSIKMKLSILIVVPLAIAFMIINFCSIKILEQVITKQDNQKAVEEVIQEPIIQLTVIAAVLGILLIGIMITIIYKMMIKPLNILSKEIAKITDYDLTSDSKGYLEKYKKRNDEIGAIGEGFFVMKESLINMIGNINHVSEELTSNAESMRAVCNTVKESGSQLSQTVEDVANGATVQAQQTTEGSSKMMDLSRLVEKVEDNMDSLKKATRQVEEIKKQGVKALDELVSKTQENITNSKQVSEVVNETSRQAERIKAASVQIQNIAEQTNLLALNAEIESARAGEAGKGFAVVATEIGNLSQQTNELTTEIDGVINDLVLKIQETLETMERMEVTTVEQEKSVGDTKNKFEEIMRNVQDMEERCLILGKSTDEMRGNEKRIADVMTDLSSLSEENAACMEEASAAVTTQEQSVEQIYDASEQMAKLAVHLREEITKFKLD